MNVPDNSSHFLYVAKGSTGQPRWRSVNLELKNNAKRFANTDIFVIIPFKRNQKNINTVAKIAKLLPLSINSSLLRELDDAIHTDDAGNEGYIIKKEIELPETDGINNLKINIDLIIFNDFIKANEAYYNIEYYNQLGGKRNVGNIYMKKSYKKRNRKRSTKKRARRARRRTKKAGEYSKLAKDLLRSKTERKIGLARKSRPIREFMQRKPFDSPDADLVDGITVDLKRAQGQAVGMASKRKAALAAHRQAKRLKRDPQTLAVKMTGPFTLGKRKRGGIRKRKTRRRRRRRR